MGIESGWRSNLNDEGWYEWAVGRPGPDLALGGKPLRSLGLGDDVRLVFCDAASEEEPVLNVEVQFGDGVAWQTAPLILFGLRSFDVPGMPEPRPFWGWDYDAFDYEDKRRWRCRPLEDKASEGDGSIDADKGGR